MYMAADSEYLSSRSVIWIREARSLYGCGVSCPFANKICYNMSCRAGRLSSVLLIFRMILACAHFERFGCIGSIREDDSISQRLFSPPGSKVLATVSRHILEVTNDGPALV